MCLQMKMNMNKSPGVPNGDSPSHGESKQLETFRKQFDQASLHFKNHSDEVEQKILTVTEAILAAKMKTWEPTNQLPSQNFKALCNQIAKLYESVADIWTRQTSCKVMLQVRTQRPDFANTFWPFVNCRKGDCVTFTIFPLLSFRST